MLWKVLLVLPGSWEAFSQVQAAWIDLWVCRAREQLWGRKGIDCKDLLPTPCQLPGGTQAQLAAENGTNTSLECCSQSRHCPTGQEAAERLAGMGMHRAEHARSYGQCKVCVKVMQMARFDKQALWSHQQEINTWL